MQHRRLARLFSSALRPETALFPRDRAAYALNWTLARSFVTPLNAASLNS